MLKEADAQGSDTNTEKSPPRSWKADGQVEEEEAKTRIPACFGPPPGLALARAKAFRWRSNSDTLSQPSRYARKDSRQKDDEITRDGGNNSASVRWEDGAGGYARVC